MWTKRGDFPIDSLPEYGLSACLETSHFLQQQNDAAGHSPLERGVGKFSFICSLGYTLVPDLTLNCAQVLLPWVLHRWVTHKGDNPAQGASLRTSQHPLSLVAHDTDLLAAFSQIEYFFTGTDNGQLFVTPLLPLHFLHALVERHGRHFTTLAKQLETTVSSFLPSFVQCSATRDSEVLPGVHLRSSASAPVSCCSRQLQHQHRREEPVLALDHNGTIIASLSEDGDVAVSFFHPLPEAITCISHPQRLRCLKLWEGGVFVDRVRPPTGTGAEDGPAGEAAAISIKEAWRQWQGHEESAAIYVFTGDVASVIRLWRVDVLEKQHTLLHVFVASPDLRHMRSSLDMMNREDCSTTDATRESTLPINCLALDGDERLLAGTEGGFYAWCLRWLSWRARNSAPSNCTQGAPSVQATTHPLCWDERGHIPLLPFLEAERGATLLGKDATEQHTLLDGLSEDYEKALRLVRLRASRLVNHHVWLREASYLQQHLSSSSTRSRSGPHLSKCKPKHGAKAAGGIAIGIVSNEVILHGGGGPAAARLEEKRFGERVRQGESVEALLSNSVVTVGFPGGELHNDLRLPLCCVEPVVYPFSRMRMPGQRCFALEVLQVNGRVVTSGSDGRCTVWVWKPESDVYVATLSSGKEKCGMRGLGQCVHRLCGPNAFISCGFENGMVKEWNVYDEPELLLRCERRFTMQATLRTATPKGRRVITHAAREELTDALQRCTHRDEAKKSHHHSKELNTSKDEESTLNGCGISCVAAFPSFRALFLVAAFESTIQSFSLMAIQGCEPPYNYIYNGHKTIRLAHWMCEEAFRKLNAT